ncbi:MAG: hypothetical protein WBG19_08590 [Thermoplasmata archaeon]
MPSSGPQGDRHLHVHLSDQHTTYYDLVTEFLQAAGKAPDWFWRLVGSFGTHEAEKMEEIISTAFEAGAFISHEHPEDVEFDWVTEEECEQERHQNEEMAHPDDADEGHHSPSGPVRGAGSATRA